MPKVEWTCPTCKQKHILSVTDSQVAGKDPIYLLCPDLDRRYRLMGFFIDTIRGFYSTPALKEQADTNTEHLKAALGHEKFEQKLERWLRIQYPPLGLIDEYPEKITQIINTYSAGYFYPAVTSACCLAERILNRLILKTREHFKGDPHYKRVYRKESFDDWGKMITIIHDWRLVPEKAITTMKELMPIRHQSIHYSGTFDFEAIASDVINKLIAAITEIFGVINRKDIYLVFDVPGEIWVRHHAQDHPFVKEFVLPHCYYAHAVHDIDFEKQKISERLGKIGQLTDDEFVQLRKTSK
ncbi:MAG: hypothetical protein RDU59_01900 [Thermodesulfobacteriota bacterium]|nr:hypothetical protein [Thermodesulfobacteriota bacterium]